MDDQLLTIEEAATRAGVSVATMRRRAAAGAVKAHKPGKGWVVEASSVMAGPRRTSIARRSRAVDLDLALSHIRHRDLTELWVPDILGCEDEMGDSVNLLATVAARLADAGPFDPTTTVDVPKTPFLSRPGDLLTIEDRIAYHAAAGSLVDRIESLLGPEVFSARAAHDPRYLLRSGTDQWLAWLLDVKKDIESGYAWMVKTDISAYFETIQHRSLFADVDALGPDPAVATSLKRMLGTWATVPGRGLPQGPDASRVLANLYLVPVDQVMTSGAWRYSRFMDDIRILGRSRREAVDGMRQLQRECRLRGLMLSADKTKLLVGDAAVASLTDAELDAISYDMEIGADRTARRRLHRVFARALRPDGTLDGRRARFSIWRLRSLRDSASLKLVLGALEDLAPLGRLVPQYLAPFLTRRTVQRRFAAFLDDPQRNTSAYLSTWLLSAMLEQTGALPDAWIRYARRVARDRNQPTYHRVVASNVLALGRRPADLDSIRDAVKSEFDPALLRGYLVALARTSALDRDTIKTAISRSGALRRTVEYLNGRKVLPSLIYPRGRRVRIA
jgi:hypothetical protein